VWQEILSAATDVEPATPPEVPFETIGIVLVAMVTGLTGIIVALIQRGKSRPADVPAPAQNPPNANTHPVFIVAKEDWDKVRDAVIRLDSEMARLRTDYDFHERWTAGEVRDLDNEISRVKGHLGLPS
jgi:hypothetical protein